MKHIKYISIACNTIKLSIYYDKNRIKLFKILSMFYIYMIIENIGELL